MSRVEVRPLPHTKWHGKKGKENISQPKTIEVLYNQTTGRFETGLTEEEAAIYGKKLGVNLSDRFNVDEAHPFWSSKASWVVLPNHPIFLDTTNPSDFVKIKNIKASKLVANSMKDFEDALYPEATHVIFDEQEEVGEKARILAIKEECVVIKSKMSADDKASIVQVLSEKTVRGRSDDFINVEVSAIIDSKPDKFLELVRMGAAEVRIRATVLELLAKNILTKEAGNIFYMGEQIALDYDDAIRYFKDPNNSKMKVIILQKLEK